MAKDVICPYCFERFELSTAWWRCSSNGCRSLETNQQLEPDEEYTRYIAEVSGTPPQQVLSRPHKFPRPQFKRGVGNLFAQPNDAVAFCDWCGTVTGNRICPFCHNDLPWAVDSLDNQILAVVGGPAAGKSHYIAVLIEQGRKVFGPNFNIAFDALNDATRKRFAQEFKEPLYQKHRQIDKTQQAPAVEPLMYRIHIQPKGGRERGMTLVFFDTAGENFQSVNELSLYARYVRHASAIILLVDPLQMEPIREKLKGAPLNLPQNPMEPSDIISRLTQQFQQFGGQKATDKIKVPIAVSFTKIDVLRDYDIIDSGGALFTAPPHEQGFRTETGRQIHDDVQSLISRYDGQEIQTLLSHYFTRYQYFGVSALGHAPALDGTLGTVSPFRVEDPLLWCLSEIGFLQKR